MQLAMSFALPESSLYSVEILSTTVSIAVLMISAISAMNTGVFSLGTNGKGEEQLRSVEFKDPQRGNYEKYFFRNGLLAGVILVGDTSKMTSMTKAMDEGASFRSIFG